MPPDPKTMTAATLWQQIELQAYESCYTSELGLSVFSDQFIESTKTMHEGGN